MPVGEVLGDRREVRFRRADVGVRCESPDGSKIASSQLARDPVAGCRLRVGQRREDVGSDMDQRPVDLEPCRHDAGDRRAHLTRSVLEPDLCADDRPVAAEPVLPEPVAQQHDRWCVGLRVGRQETAADRRIDAQKREESGRDLRPFEAEQLRIAHQDRLPWAADGQAGELVELAVPGLGRGTGRDPVAGALARMRLPQRHQLPGVGVGQRPQQDRVGDAEDRGAGTDPESQRRDGCRGDRRVAPQQAEAELKIVGEGLHPSGSGLDTEQDPDQAAKSRSVGWRPDPVRKRLPPAG